MGGGVMRAARRLAGRAPVSLLASASTLWHGETAAQRRLARSVTGLRGRGQRRDVVEEATAALGPTGPVLAVTTTTFSAQRALADSLDLVVSALEADDVPYAVLEAGTARPRVVVVMGAADGERAHAALARELAGRAVYASPVEGDRLGRAVPVAQVQQRLGVPAVLRVFRPLRAQGTDPGDGTLLAGPELGCDLEVWPVQTGAGPHPPGTGTAPRPNRWAAYLTPEQQRPVGAEVDGRRVRTYEGLLRPHLLDVQFPIDVVYTWVDGDDDAWAARKEAAWAAADHAAYHPLAANASRFSSHDELRYSLRSLEMHADWVRHVYVVTDGQVPGWLRTDHPKLRVVDHRELFGDAGRLPTFNSHAIESRLHHIDGLAEHYLYLNDDFFFGRPVAPELFFHGNGLAKFFLTPSTIDLASASPLDLPVVSAAKATRSIMEKAFDRTVTQKFQHVAYPQRRSVLLDLERRFADVLARTADAQFRSPEDASVAASLSHYYGYATGRAVPGHMSYRYCDIAERRAPLKLQRLLRHRDADMFCLNEIDAAEHGRAHALAHDFLERYFPLASSFEA
ncbi:stealth family protein [Angustibacter aerolatus]